MSNTNHQVAHLWANQSKDSAKSSNGNFSFRGDDLYSYSTVIASRVRNARGQTAYIVTDRRYSITTSSRHMPALWSSLRGHPEPVFRSDPRHTPREVLAALATSHHSALLSAGKNKRYAQKHFDAANSIRESAEAIAAFFDLPAPDLPEPSAKAIAAAKIEDEKQKAAQTERDRLASERHEREYAARRERQETALQSWIVGDNVSTYDLPRQDYALLRVKGDTLQTSMGAEVPLNDAVRAFRLARLVVARGEAWPRNGEACNVGDFQIDRIAPDGTIRAGCHLIAYAEAARIAREIGEAC